VWDSVLRLHKNRRPISLATSDRTDVPVTVGLRTSTIILPVDSLSWTSRRLEMVLAHELAHVERRDVAWNLLGRVACGLAWFNPLVWFAARRMVCEREQACDDRVVSAGFPPSEYASILLQFASELTGKEGVLAGAVSVAEPPIARRIRAILVPQLSRDTVSWRQRALTVALLGGVTIALGMLRPLTPLAESADNAARAGGGSENKAPDNALPATGPANQPGRSRKERAELVNLPAIVTGQVVSADDKPLDGARVELSLVESGRGFFTAPIGSW
jgi:hypothetical protein